VRRQSGESMMKTQPRINKQWLCCSATVFLGAGIVLLSSAAGFTKDMNFDSRGQQVFQKYDSTPESYMSADSGNRNLRKYYSLRQYPGAPPRIPHPVEASFSESAPDCLSCHEKGGFSPEHNAFIPVTPHPQEESCRQCHVVLPEEQTVFVEHDWESIPTPRLGVSAMGGSPPLIPHTLQLRENCISCHTGPAAVVEIRVDHAARGNCRQCHVPLVQSEPVKVFTRNEQP